MVIGSLGRWYKVWVKKNWRGIFVSTAKLVNPRQFYWSKGQKNSLRQSKWNIVHLCKSNSSWDMTKNVENFFFKNLHFCKKKSLRFTKWFFHHLCRLQSQFMSWLNKLSPFETYTMGNRTYMYKKMKNAASKAKD